jgi:hypothetical protein
VTFANGFIFERFFERSHGAVSFSESKHIDIVLATKGGYCQQLNIWLTPRYFLDDLETALLGHKDVRNRQMDVLVLDHIHALLSVSYLLDLVTA